MLRVCSLIIAMCAAMTMVAENPSINYIAQYKEIAILEMQRTGIPASIKMAQALLESGAGTSTLARKANNHFGIKCGGGWNGESFYREDDDYYKGELIKSCFRKFGSAHESFMAHSEFLMNQRRYGFLFELDGKDYKSWAKGLRKAGYATDKQYAYKLIELIEKYELYVLDEHARIYEGEVLAETQKEEEVEIPSIEGDSEIATADENSDLARGNRESRMRSYYSNAEKHTVRKNESLSDIARLYDIDENALRIRNRLPKDAVPLPGETIHLRKKISLLSRPKFERGSEQDIASADTEFIF